jgi:peptidoglycan/LPS O-acetylase OafA/YrhL
MHLPSAKTPRIIGLDLPRALAISLVLLSHCVKRLEITGFYGVELFFALSGFLIGGILYREISKSRSWTFADAARFWKRRWWRTLPNYYLFLLVFVVFSYFEWGLPTFGKFLRYFVFAQNMQCGNSAFYGVSWSLCIEEWFYLLFPLSLLALSKAGVSKRWAFGIVTISFLAGPALLRERLFAVCAPEDIRMMTFARLDAIVYGVAAAFVVNRFEVARFVRGIAFVAGLALVLAAVAFGAFDRADETVSFYRLAFWIVPGGFALMLPLLERIRRFPAALSYLSEPVEKLSLWSYSIYLCHIPVLFSVYAVFGSSRNNAIINAASKAVAVAIVLLVSRFIFRRFETPLMARQPR